jgi:hypothetical protein
VGPRLGACVGAEPPPEGGGVPPGVPGTIEGTVPEGAMGKVGMLGNVGGAIGANVDGAIVGSIVGAAGSTAGGVGKVGGVRARKATARARPKPATVRSSPVQRSARLSSGRGVQLTARLTEKSTVQAAYSCRLFCDKLPSVVRQVARQR